MASAFINLFSPLLPKKSGDKLAWGLAQGTAASIAIAEAACAHTGSSLVITRNMSEAASVERDLIDLLRDQPQAPRIVHFADWETLPYDSFSPHQDIVSERMRTLYQLAHHERCLVIASTSTLMQRIAPPAFILANSVILKKGDTLDWPSLQQRLIEAGYNKVQSVYQHGEFAVRGAIIDLYPMGSQSPLRIELFDTEVDSLRLFDPETQRTASPINAVDILPAKECPLDTAARALFKQQWHSAFDVDHRSCPVYQAVASGQSAAGIEYYLPLFFNKTASLLDYCAKDTWVFCMGDIEQAATTYWDDVVKRYDNRQGDRFNPVLEPAQVFFPINSLFEKIKPLSRIQLSATAVTEKAGHYNLPIVPLPAIAVDDRAQEPLNALHAFLMQFSGRILFSAETAGRREMMVEQLKRIMPAPPQIAQCSEFFNAALPRAITLGAWETGFIVPAAELAWIPEAVLFGQRIPQNRRKKRASQDPDAIIKNLTELKLGAPVVHIDHGVGRYQGLEVITVDKTPGEFVVLEYANEARLYIPVANLHLISRYGGGEDYAPLHRLGTEQWRQAKEKAAQHAADIAAELLAIYAKREAKEGFIFENPKDALRQFAAGFPFEETLDQEQAINAVRSDMLSSKPMDRLVCGDVGFGKTEVAMRAAFIAVHNHKQVVVLVPTTLLAQQHFDNFSDRFADWPVTIEVLSRFKSAKQTQEALQKINDGKIDIVIGTHKLLSSDLKFPRLGLLIIDEEHRFGVRQKETLKAFRADVDILTLTATPIPRTLNMAMNGIRDLSIIATPPAKRLSVKTFVRQEDPTLIKEAILREILRGGQVYYLHNEVATIEKCAESLRELVPEAKVDIGHGQMRERELESVMSDFYHKRFNVFVCSTIIETGIDVPNANTIIIERADKFGLAQLHQLRGRVGRSHHQAYAYLLTPPPKSLTVDAEKRLEAIAQAQDLGAGFTLASHDLEIRGAGELLGDEQSGQIQAIGFSLYMDMLDRAVNAIRRGESIDITGRDTSGCDINLRIPALIPDDYLPDINTRLIFYKRIASIACTQDADDIHIEMIDRFGLLPEPLKYLFRIAELKLRAIALGIIKIEGSATGGKLEFSSKPNVEPLTIIRLVQQQPQHFRIEGGDKLRFTLDMPSADERLDFIDKLLTQLETP
jgi:transcription-repair coupling factor (superfamily II helicase)